MASDSPCDDPDGDGYGWNGSSNCPPFLGTVDGQVARLVTETGNLQDFGSNVTIEDDRMLVADTNKVFILERNASSQWSMDSTLSIDDPESSGFQSIYNFALQGDTIVIPNENADSMVPLPGTPYEFSRQTGAAYVFTKTDGGDWVQQAKLTASDAQEWDRFGRSIALSGDLLLVGAPDKEREDAYRGPGVTPGPWSEGAVYVFRRNSQGEWIEEATIQRDDDYANFGSSIHLAANGVAIIASGYDVSPYVFKRVASGDWREISRMESVESAFGTPRSYALDSESLLVSVGRTVEDHQIHEYINNGDGTFSYKQFLDIARNGTIKIDGDTALVEYKESYFSSEADIRVYKRSSDSSWSHYSTLKSSLDDNTSFGSRFAVSGDTVVAGASASYNSLFKRGSVYVFDISQPNNGQRSDTSCVDPDGDGWGWNSLTNSSCNVSEPSNGNGTSNTNALCVDPDGDGWGWNGTDSCRVIMPSGSEISRCDYSNANIYDGWGWNAVTGESCRPLDLEVLQECDYSQSEEFSGWGWNAATLESCPPLQNRPNDDCDYSDADLYAGWGWNPVTHESCPPI